jgi:hypothetical protein
MDAAQFDDFYAASFERVVGQVYAQERAVSGPIDDLTCLCDGGLPVDPLPAWRYAASVTGSGAAIWLAMQEYQIAMQHGVVGEFLLTTLNQDCFG